MARSLRRRARLGSHERPQSTRGTDVAPRKRPATLVVMVCLAACVAGGASGQTTAPRVRVERLLDAPIIGPELDPSIGENIQGPSLIRVPDWIEDPLGTYYLYFADHKGHYGVSESNRYEAESGHDDRPLPGRRPHRRGGMGQVYQATDTKLNRP